MVRQTVSEGLKAQLPIVVQSLIGRASLPFYLDCLQSLLKHSKDKINLLIHEDGSLQESDREQARRQLGENTQFIDLGETKEKTLDQLSGYPHCQAMRKNSLWGIEFFDPLFAQPENPISYYIDADILFLRPFFGLFEPKEVKGGALFLRDIQWDAYSLRPWHLFGFGMRPVIVKGITTALVCWDKRAIDWNYLEWFLGQFRYHDIPEWILPTAQAGLATRCQAKTVFPEQLPNLYPNASVSDETFGVHLLGSYREKWLPKVKQHMQEMEPSHEPHRARFLPCQPRGALGYASNHGKRWVNTRLNRW